MRLGDTIVAIASGGPAPRGMVRVSGPDARAVLALLTPDARWAPGGHRTRLRLECGGGSQFVPALLTIFTAPKSFTGEDTFEIVCAGNQALLERIAGGAISLAGNRQALPGEFTARAFLHGKLTPEQAEGVGALIAARNDEELTAGRRLLSGETGAAYRSLADELSIALALVEAGIDFVDEDDVVAIAPDALLERLDVVLTEINAMLGAARGEESCENVATAVLVGPPNAGKSTLFNALLKRERSVVSEVSGTTRDAIVEHMDLAALGWIPGTSFGGRLVSLVDLAGLDEALGERSSLDQAGQRAAQAAIEGAEVVVLCDPQGRFEQREVLATMVTRGRPVIRVVTKADLPGSSCEQSALRVCALDGWNLGALARAIGDAVESVNMGGASAVLPRHRQALASARQMIETAIERVGVDAGRPSLSSPETAAVAMREALDHLGEIAGRISPDDVIGRIFSTFCIGK